MGAQCREAQERPAGHEDGFEQKRRRGRRRNAQQEHDVESNRQDLKLEDIVPDLTVPTPEQETEAAELRRCVDEALAELPSAWRRAVLLRHVNGLAGAALARAVGRPEAETDRMLDHARAYLRQRLVESGCAFQGADGR